MGRAFDVFSLAGQLCIIDDGEIFSCDLTPHGKQRRIYTQRDPLKAISAITPFNHPMNMVAHKVAPAIATNNCMVCKPTELTPLTALLLADVLYEAGLPPEMFSVVTGLPGDIGEEMITNDHIELITFTGGVAVGKHIANHAGYRRTVLELGGNSSLIVMEDADLEKAAAMAVQGATKNSGQRCTAVKRVLCVESVADEFAPLVVSEAQRSGTVIRCLPIRIWEPSCTRGPHNFLKPGSMPPSGRGYATLWQRPTGRPVLPNRFGSCAEKCGTRRRGNLWSAHPDYPRQGYR